MKAGDRVDKVSGYRFPGVIIARFRTLAGAERCVVECTALPGLLHIFSPEQLLLAVPHDDGNPHQDRAEGTDESDEVRM